MLGERLVKDSLEIRLLLVSVFCVYSRKCPHGKVMQWNNLLQVPLPIYIGASSENGMKVGMVNRVRFEKLPYVHCRLFNFTMRVYVWIGLETGKGGWEGCTRELKYENGLGSLYHL